MKYEKGDKVVVEITEVDEKDKELTYGVGNPTWIRSKYILGKLEDFTESKKIKFSEAEKKEFDKLLKVYSAADLNDLLDTIYDYSKTYSATYSALHKRLFENAKVTIDRKRQFEFARALENPNLIEVIKPKRYYVHLILDKPRTYLGYERTFKTYFISGKDKETHNSQMKFTKDEIKNFDLSFEIKPEVLEEAEEDENDI